MNETQTPQIYTRIAAIMKDKLVQLCYAIAGIVAIVGALVVYIHMNSDGKKTAKYIMIAIGSMIALVALAQSLPYLAH